jgi:hypothetical protein
VARSGSFILAIERASTNGIRGEQKASIREDRGCGAWTVPRRGRKNGGPCEAFSIQGA